MRAILIDPVAETVTEIAAEGLRGWYAALGCSCVDIVNVARGSARSLDLVVDDVGRMVEGQRCFAIKTMRGPVLIAGRAFRIGVAVRMGERFQEMARAAETKPEASGSRALVPVKDALIRSWMADNGIRLGKARSSSVGSRGAFGAGKDAGGSVGIHRGVGSARSGTLQLR